jgi:hypothetical protein
MLHGAEVAVCSQIYTTHTNMVWKEHTIAECYTCWCIM